MRKLTLLIGLSALLLAALACGPTVQNTPGPTVDAVPPPTETPIPPAPQAETPAEMPPAPTPDGSGVGGTPVSNEPGDNTLEGFQQALLDNINSRNYEFLMYAMNDPFALGGWRAGGSSLSAAEAVEKLRVDLLPPENVVSYDLDKDITALLDGTPPDQMYGPDVKIVSAVFMDGWGADGNAEVIIFISQKPEGYFTWYGLIYAGQGFK